MNESPKMTPLQPLLEETFGEHLELVQIDGLRSQMRKAGIRVLRHNRTEWVDRVSFSKWLTGEATPQVAEAEERRRRSVRAAGAAGS